MSNIFQSIWHGIEVGAVDTGKAAWFLIKLPFKAAEELPKVVTVVDDLKQDATTLIPEAAVMAGDVEDIFVTSGKDTAAFLLASKTLWPAVLAAVEAGGTNVALDAAIIGEIEPFLDAAKAFVNLYPKFEKLATDFGTFKGSIAAGLQKLETDVTA